MYKARGCISGCVPGYMLKQPIIIKKLMHVSENSTGSKNDRHNTAKAWLAS